MMAADTEIFKLGKTYHRNFKKTIGTRKISSDKPSRSVPKNKALGFDISKSSITHHHEVL
jgi:hypothetical protein